MNIKKFFMLYIMVLVMAGVLVTHPFVSKASSAEIYEKQFYETIEDIENQKFQLQSLTENRDFISGSQENFILLKGENQNDTNTYQNGSYVETLPDLHDGIMACLDTNTEVQNFYEKFGDTYKNTTGVFFFYLRNDNS